MVTTLKVRLSIASPCPPLSVAAVFHSNQRALPFVQSPTETLVSEIFVVLSGPVELTVPLPVDVPVAKLKDPKFVSELVFKVVPAHRTGDDVAKIDDLLRGLLTPQFTKKTQVDVVDVAPGIIDELHREESVAGFLVPISPKARFP